MDAKSVNDSAINQGNFREVEIANKPEGKQSVYLQVEDQVYGDNGLYKIPLYTVTTCKQDNKPEEKDAVLIQCLPLLYATEHLKKTEVKSMRKGWLYVYVDGYLWRELEFVDEQGVYRDVNLRQFAGEHSRPSSGKSNHVLLVPHRLEGAQTKVEIAYSQVQWSWYQITAFGGVNPRDERAKSNPKVYACSDETAAEKNRKSRMVTLEGLSDYSNGFSTESGEHLSSCDNIAIDAAKMYQGKNIAAIFLPDFIGVSLDYATQYQKAWHDLESYIFDLRNAHLDPGKSERFPFSRWFDSALLANSYFFTEFTEIKESKLSKEVRKHLVQAKKQRKKWQSHLSLRDIEIALGKEKRIELRDKIAQAKLPLVKMLNAGMPSASYLQIYLRDYLWLMPEADESKACCSDIYHIMSIITDRLDWNKYKLDQHLETQPLKASELKREIENDKGVEIALQIASNQHQLSMITLPQEEKAFTPPDNIQVANGWLYRRPSTSDEALALLSASHEVARRGSQAMSEWITRLTDAAIKAEQNSVAAVQTLISRSPIARMLQGKLVLTEVKLGDYLSGNLNTDKLSVLRVAVEEESRQLSNKEKSVKMPQHSLDDSINNAPKAGQFKVFQPQTKELLYTDYVDGFKDGNAFKNSSRKTWKKARHKSTFYETKVKLWVYQTPKATERLALKLVEKELFSRVVLPVVAVLEAVNLAKTSTKALELYRDEKYTDLVVGLSSAFLDMAAITAHINELLKKQQFAKAHGYQVFDRMPKAVKETFPAKTIIVARTLGAGASLVSAGIAIKDMLTNMAEGDDAAYAHLTYGIGFSLMAAAETAALLVKTGFILEASAIGAFSLGPALLIGLVMVLAGAALLAWVFTEDTEIEQWLKFGPFSKTPDNILLTGASRVKPYGLYQKPGQLMMSANLFTLAGGTKKANQAKYTWRFKESAFMRLDPFFKVLEVYDDGYTLIKENKNIYTRQTNPEFELIGGIGANIKSLIIPNAFVNKVEEYYRHHLNDPDYQLAGTVWLSKGEQKIRKAQLMPVGYGTQRKPDDVAYYLRFNDDSRILLNSRYEIMDVQGDFSSSPILKKDNDLFYVLEEESKKKWVGEIGQRLNLLPFENTRERFTHSKEDWKQNGDLSFKALVSGIASPSLDLQVEEVNSESNYKSGQPAEYVAYADIHLPYFIDDKSLLIVELNCNQKNLLNSGARQFMVPGNGPKTIKIEQPILNYTEGTAIIELKVRLDVMGDGTAVLPISQDWIAVTEEKSLGRHEYEIIAMRMERE